MFFAIPQMLCLRYFKREKSDEIKEESYVYKGNGYILVSGNDG